MNSHPRCAGFTLVELLVVVAVIAILLSMVMAATGVLRQGAASVVCKNNLRQFGVAYLTYTADNRGYWPNYDWNNQLLDYATGGGSSTGMVVRLYHCPGAADAHLSYTGVYYNSVEGPSRDGVPPSSDKWPFAWVSWVWWYTLTAPPRILDARISKRTTKVVMSEVRDTNWWGSNSFNDRCGSRMHGTGGNFLLADGRVQFLKLPGIKLLGNTTTTIPGFKGDPMWAPYSTATSKFME